VEHVQFTEVQTPRRCEHPGDLWNPTIIAGNGHRGSPRILLLRESLITGFVGVALLASMLFPRPLMFYLAQSTAAQHSPEEGDRFGLLWEKPGFVRCIYLLTWIWGTALILETIIRATLAWSIPTEQFLLISPIIGYSLYFSLIGWTFWYVRRLKAATQEPQVNS